MFLVPPLLESENMKNDIPTLDLHGTKHQDAEAIVENFVLLHSESPMKVITGNSKKMKDIVVSVLEWHDFQFSHPDDYNLGTFMVYGSPWRQNDKQK